MSRTVSSQVDTEIAKVVTAPGYLVEILFPEPIAPLRVSSRGDVQFTDGRFFISANFQVNGLGTDISTSLLSGSIDFQDSDYAISTMVLLYGVGDREVNVWQFYGDATLGASDAVFLGPMRGADSAFDFSGRKVSISLLMNNLATLYAPRTYLTKENGFNQLCPAGLIIQWGSQKYIVNPDGA